MFIIILKRNFYFIVINNRTRDPYETRQLVKSLQGHGWRLNSEEQDAHEFFNLLSTTVDEEVHLKRKTETIIPSIFSDDGRETKNGKSHSRPSPFQGYLASQLCCLTCGYKVYDCIIYTVITYY